MRSLERRLFEALRNKTGMNLTADDVWDLAGRDDAVRARMANACCQEAGVPEIGSDSLVTNKTWKENIELLRKDYEE